MSQDYFNLKTAYISGPMTGYKDYNYPRFFEEAHRLENLGYTVLNPADHNLGDKEEWHTYMREALKKLLQADFIVLLEGWEKSRGAKIEVKLADNLDMEIVYTSMLDSRCQYDEYLLIEKLKSATKEEEEKGLIDEYKQAHQ